jgi:hypothetical protein
VPLLDTTKLNRIDLLADLSCILASFAQCYLVNLMAKVLP